MSLKHSPEQETGNEQAEQKSSHVQSNQTGGQQHSTTGRTSEQQKSSTRAKVEQLGRETKEKVNEAKEKVDEATKEIRHEVKEKVDEAAHDLKQGMSEVTHDIREEAESMADERKSEAAQRLGGVASTLRQTGHNFEEHDESTLAYYTNSLADQIDSLSHSLRDREIGELIDDARQMAQRQPELFVTGALAVGFMVGRFLKSSATSTRERRQQGGYGQNYPYMEDTDDYYRRYTEYDPRGYRQSYANRPTGQPDSYGQYPDIYGDEPQGNDAPRTHNTFSSTEQMGSQQSRAADARTRNSQTDKGRTHTPLSGPGGQEK